MTPVKLVCSEPGRSEAGNTSATQHARFLVRHESVTLAYDANTNTQHYFALLFLIATPAKRAIHDAWHARVRRTDTDTIRGGIPPCRQGAHSRHAGGAVGASAQAREDLGRLAVW